MAYGEKYRIYSNGQFGVDDLIVKIYKKDHAGAVGSVEALTGGTPPVSIAFPGKGDDDLFYPIIGSELTLSIIVTTTGQFDEFIEVSNKEYYAIVYNSTQSSIQWQGWLIPEELEIPYTAPPYPLKLKFSCGLGALRNTDYLASDDSYYTGREKEITIIAQALASLAPDDATLSLSIKVANSLLPTSSSTSDIYSAFDLAYTNQDKYINDDGTVWDCFNVLLDILTPYGCRIIHGEEAFWILRIDDMKYLTEGKDMHYVVYDNDGVYVSDGHITESDVVKEVTGPHVSSRVADIFWQSAPRLRYEGAWKQFTIDFDYGYRNVFKFADLNLDDWADFWEPGGILSTSVVRVQDYDDPDLYAISIPYTLGGNTFVDYTIENVIAGAEAVAYFRAETLIRGLPSSAVGTKLVATMQVILDGGRSLQGRLTDISGSTKVTPYWNLSIGNVVTKEIALEDEDTWVTFEFAIPGFPLSGDLIIRLFNPTSDTSPDVPEECLWRRPSLLLNYDPSLTEKSKKLTTVVSSDNLKIPSTFKLTSGDVQLSNFINEHIAFKNSKTTNSTGTALTNTWQAYYYDGGKVATGSEQSLLIHYRDGYHAYRNLPRRRITGTLYMNWHRMFLTLIKDQGFYYLPTSFTQTPNEGKFKLSMLEFGAYELADLLITVAGDYIETVDGDYIEYTA